MKALAIDSASSYITVSAKNEDNCVTLSLDIGPKQSQELLPAIDYVLSKVGLEPNELDYITLCKGPGTFTGLRLAFAAAKAISLAFKTPVYAVSTLECYAFAYKNFCGQVVSTIDAKKDQFFAAIYKNGTELFEPQDTSAEKVIEKLTPQEPILCTGSDAKTFAQILKEKNSNLNVIYFESEANPAHCLFAIAESMIEQKKEPLKDFEGPEYLRKSEAELALEKK